ncbi:hypothetical protein TcBrA4_0135790 [Trypanosoma cruzi]|nr:hypothetical protein TcBrA4_0135790 [Trypanosoma cruzi]
MRPYTSINDEDQRNAASTKKNETNITFSNTVNPKKASSDNEKTPAESPFKSVFGAPSSTAAKPPAESPFKSVFGAPSSTAAEPPAESPFKNVFGAPSSTAAKPPAESPFKSVFGAPSSTAAKPPAELALKELGGTSCGKNGVWKCFRCGKAKDLSGEHLKNRTEYAPTVGPVRGSRHSYWKGKNCRYVESGMWMRMITESP